MAFHALRGVRFTLPFSTITVVQPPRVTWPANPTRVFILEGSANGLRELYVVDVGAVGLDLVVRQVFDAYSARIRGYRFLLAVTAVEYDFGVVKPIR